MELIQEHIFNMTKRFFAFGCSFTKYAFLTWADCVAYALSKQGYECYNYGNPGAGNRQILSNMVKADSVHNFTDDDVIMVLWSGWNREDRYVERNNRGLQWASVGSVHNNGLYDERFLERYWSIENDVINSITSVVAGIKAYKPRYSGHMHDIYELVDFTGKEEEQDRLFAQLTSSNIHNLFSIEHAPDSFSKELYEKDGHTSILQHYNYVKKMIEPRVYLGLDNPDTQEWVNAQHERMRQAYENSSGNWNVFSNHINRTFSKHTPFIKDTVGNLWCWKQNIGGVESLLDWFKDKGY